MVVEVIVKDPARADTDEAEGEPTVLVDNMRLRDWHKVWMVIGMVTLVIKPQSMQQIDADHN